MCESCSQGSTGRLAGYLEQIIDLDKSFLTKLKARLKLELVLFRDNGQLVVASHPDFYLYKKNFFQKYFKQGADSFFELNVRSNPYGFLIYPLEWGKSTFYEESSGVPIIVAGDDIPAGATRATPVSHVDIYPWIFECVGAPVPDDDDHPGRSLGALARDTAAPKPVVCEYHAISSTGASFMLRDGRWKYLHYVNYRPQLYDLETDIGESRNVAATNPRVVRRLQALAVQARADLGDAATGVVGRNVRPSGTSQ